MAEATKKYAVVTGANKGIGFEICRKLASNGIVVVLTAKDEKKGLEAVEKLREFGLSDHVVFHQLDVADPASIASFADFIKTKYGKLDILVNNARIAGSIIDGDALAASGLGKKIPNEWAKEVLGDAESLTEERVDEVLNEYLKDFKEDSLETKGWPRYSSPYIISKAAMNACTRIVAKKYPSFRVNCVCPGYVKTDINYNNGYLTTDEGAESVVKLALLPNDGPSGLFFYRNEVTTFD
nr:(+)-neomenthol dehydrogenase-like isoform X1 [Quercus suber]